MHIASSQDFGRAVRTLRRQLGITQADLALTSGTNRRFIIDLEAGKPTCQLDKALRVVATLGGQLALDPRAGVTAHDRGGSGKVAK